MRAENGEIIYVGKAKQLKNRVLQYFGSLTGQTRKVMRMVSRVADFDYYVTGSEMEALLLENTQIKQHKPYYNILLKDNKTYPYIRINLNDEYPRLTLTRRRSGSDKGRYFGPYSGSVKQIIETVNKAFRLPSCTREFPRDIGKSRPCINKELGLCAAPCSGSCTKEEYAEAVKGAVAFLQGDLTGITGELTKRMEAAAEALNFEEAARCRDRLKAIKKLEIKQKVVDAPGVNRDVIGYSANGFKLCFEVFFIRGGKIMDRHHFFFDPEFAEDLSGAARAFITQLYAERADIPGEILCAALPEDSALVAQYLSGLRGRPVKIFAPQKGEKKKLTDMVCQNASETLRLLMTREEKQQKSLVELQRLLGLETVPRSIEAVDISNTGGAETVSALIRFENAQPFKNGYRRYKIKSVEGQDDYKAMAEVICRRFIRYLNQDEGFEKLPDLLLLDGGAGHLSVISGILSEMGVSVPVFGMVKDSHHRTRAIVSPGGEIALRPGTPAAILIGRIQEEVHRFAIEYHRKRREAPLTVSKLTAIDGIGENRARALLKHFGSLKLVAKAELTQLRAAPGMTNASAKAVFEYFNAPSQND